LIVYSKVIFQPTLQKKDGSANLVKPHVLW